MKNIQDIKRGAIWLVNLGTTSGSIQGGVRPVIVISNDMANVHSPVIHVVPVTTRAKNNLPTHVEIDETSGLNTLSTAMAEQSMLINKESFIKLVGKLDAKQISKIEKALLIQFGLFEKIKELLAQNKKYKEQLCVRC